MKGHRGFDRNQIGRRGERRGRRKRIENELETADIRCSCGMVDNRCGAGLAFPRLNIHSFNRNKIFQDLKVGDKCCQMDWSHPICCFHCLDNKMEEKKNIQVNLVSEKPQIAQKGEGMGNTNNQHKGDSAESLLKEPVV